MDEINLVTVFPIPADLPEETVLTDKEGQNPRTIHPRRRYRSHYAEGFEECRDRFLGLGRGHYVRQDGIVDPYFENRIGRLIPHPDPADQAGFRNCREQLEDLSARYGVARVRAALQRRYGSWYEIAGYYILKSVSYLTFALPVIIAAVLIRAIARIVNHRHNSVRARTQSRQREMETEH
jgi:hypothetical protein